MKKLEFHPASAVFRLLEGAEFKELCDSLEKYGQQVSIKVLDGKIIDGRNRYNGCLKVKIEPWLEHLTKADLEGMSPLDYVVAMNQHRRHDDPGQRALAAARIKEQYAAEAKERQKLSEGAGKKGPVILPDLSGDSRDKAGEAMGVSGKTVDLAEKVLHNSPPEVIAAVEKGHVAVSDAAKIVDLPPAKQKAAVAKVESGKAPTLAAAVKPKTQSAAAPFDQLQKSLGKSMRFADSLNKAKPCQRQHKVILDSLDTASKAVSVWRKSVT